MEKFAFDPNVYDLLRESIAPTIYGHDRIKDALVLQIFGGVRKIREDGVVTRGDTHILLIGDPGTGKSQLVKRLSNVAPKARFVSGKGVSGARLFS
ncbi:MAG: ATP-binding protein [Candidatus Portnoybacteria bacterium]